MQHPRGRRICAHSLGAIALLRQSAAPRTVRLDSGATASDKRRNKAIAPYDPQFASGRVKRLQDRVKWGNLAVASGRLRPVCSLKSA
jgi:hypothetical protein